MAEEQISRTDLVRREALTQAVMWAAHRAVPQTLSETLKDAEVIETWLLGQAPAEGPRPGEVVVLQPGETHLDAARRRRGWPPVARPGETVGEALARHAAAEDLSPAENGLEHWQELKRLDNLLLAEQEARHKVVRILFDTIRAGGDPMRTVYMEMLEPLLGDVPDKPPADRG